MKKAGTEWMLEELRELLARTPDKLTHDNVAALQSALDVVEAVDGMVIVCQYPCGNPRMCGNCATVEDALLRFSAHAKVQP